MTDYSNDELQDREEGLDSLRQDNGEYVNLGTYFQKSVQFCHFRIITSRLFLICESIV